MFRNFQRSNKAKQTRQPFIANREKANDSLECRNCHQFRHMDFTKQSKQAAKFHSTALGSGKKTCTDFHKGIARQILDMAGVPGL
jgi:cytochrome c-type protein NapC